jgi:glutamate-1-semialdehyde 2,1-aminomutase
MVKFAKNGSNATTAAAKIARAFTGREYICVPRQHPFFSFDDWFISTTPMRRGIPSSLPARTLVFDYNDIDSLSNLFDAYPDSIAGVMLEPSTAITPCSQACVKTLSEYSPCRECSSENFLHQVQRLCQAQGALFILDEMITGFRWSLSGAGSYFGVEPDLCTFGKAMSNGFSVAAVAGRREVMEVGSIDRPGQERTFLLSSTHGGEMTGLRAFMETVAIYRETDVVSHLWNYGAALKSGLQEVAQAANASHLFQIEGPPVSLNYVLRDLDGESSLPLRTLFSQEMIRLGVLMPWISASQSHGEGELQLTLEAAVQALAIVRRAAYTNVADFLEGPAVKPVFREFN